MMDVDTLKKLFVDPLHLNNLLADEPWFPSWRESVHKVFAEGTRMMNSLEGLQRRTESGIVEGIDGVVKQHERDVARALYVYFWFFKSVDHISYFILSHSHNFILLQVQVLRTLHRHQSHDGEPLPRDAGVLEQGI